MKYNFIIEAKDAKEIAKKSDAEFQRILQGVFQEIKAAATNGKCKTYYPQNLLPEFDERLKEILVLNGYSIGAYSSDIWNTAIHW